MFDADQVPLATFPDRSIQIIVSAGDDKITIFRQVDVFVHHLIKTQGHCSIRLSPGVLV